MFADTTAEPWCPVPAPEADSGSVPIDTRCPGCGLDRPMCASRLCSRRPYDDEEDGDGDD